MAISACMNCLKSCGYLCGLLAALNIWFWIGMTVFNAMNNPWIKKELLLFPEYTSDSSRFTTVFGVCIALNVVCMIACCFCTKAGCYQDKDQVAYYTPSMGASSSLDVASGRLNGSRDGSAYQQRTGLIEAQRPKETQLIDLN